MVNVKEKANQSTPKLLENFYMIVEPEQKLNSLLKFIVNREIKKAMLFLPTCACVEYWSEVLPHLLQSTKILSIHGKMKQKRGKILKKFRDLDNVILLCTDVMARGVDIEEMDWVFQWEPPSEADVFVHRVGRTARQGTEGNALIMLLPTEAAYVDFLSKNQKVNMQKVEINDEWCEELPRLNKKIHNLQRKDKNVFDKGTRAFVSHVKAYSKHKCHLLLRVRDLDLGKVATSYGLLRLPKMPEMKQQFQATFIAPSGDVNINGLEYKNKQKQKAYQKKQEVYQETGEWPGKKNLRKTGNDAWDEAKNKREFKKENRKKRQEVKKTINEKKASGDVVVRKRKVQYTEDDLKELAKDIAAIKKFKKNKISKKELDTAMGLEDGDSD
jgi:ATP-dependent RNA helicase DDX55/SPB4